MNTAPPRTKLAKDLKLISVNILIYSPPKTATVFVRWTFRRLFPFFLEWNYITTHKQVVISSKGREAESTQERAAQHPRCSPGERSPALTHPCRGEYDGRGNQGGEVGGLGRRLCAWNRPLDSIRRAAPHRNRYALPR